MDPAECSDKSDPLIDISPDGDVVLVVGPQKRRLRVQSECLRCASRVFGAMFGPHWSEGQGLSKEFPKEVPLVEDDADALHTICCVIHHRNEVVPQVLAASEVLQIAIETDKYDCRIALKYASAQWLQPRDNADMVEQGYLMAAAYLLGDMETFAAHTLALILRYAGSYLELLDKELISQTVPWKVFYLLEERRNRVRAALGKIFVDEIHCGCSRCGWISTRSAAYVYLLRHEHLGPLAMLETPISSIIKGLETMADPPEEFKWCSGTSGLDGDWHKTLTYREALTGKLETLKKKASICLDCVRNDDSATPCKFRHE